MGKTNQVLRTAVLFGLGIVYLALVGATFILNIDLVTAKGMQYAVHITVILTAFAYLFFLNDIYRAEEDKTNGKMAFLFGALFAIPLLIGRGIGLAALSNEFSNANEMLNFYAGVSVSRPIEMISWTTLFPFSMLFLAKAFFSRRNRILGILCAISAVCSFIAFLSFVSAKPIFTLIGVFGWGILFTIIILIYLLKQIKELRKRN
jgi:small neutral amino acid transporter SnatA (MarC family)